MNLPANAALWTLGESSRPHAASATRPTIYPAAALPEASVSTPIQYAADRARRDIGAPHRMPTTNLSKLPSRSHT